MEILKQHFIGKNFMRNILAITWSLFAMLYTYQITFGNVPDSGVRFADVSQGFLLGTIVAGIIGFHFGSSQGSSDKTDIIKKSQENKNA